MRLALYLPRCSTNVTCKQLEVYSIQTNTGLVSPGYETLYVVQYSHTLESPPRQGCRRYVSFELR